MSNEKEYIELFEQNRTLVESNCSALLNGARSTAFESFKVAGFPTPKEEKYRYTDVRPIFAENYGMNLGRVAAPINPKEYFSCDVPNLHTLQEYIVNDTYYNNTEKDGLPEGAILGSLNTIAAQHPEILAPYYNALASKGDGVTHFNTTFVQDGIVLYIPRNKKAETTVQLMNLLRTNVEMLFNRRLLIILEDGAEASMLICDHAVEKIKTLSVQVAEVFLGCNASFDLYELEETQAENRRINQLFVRQQAGSRFNHTNITLTNGVTRNSAHVSLEGEGAEVNMYGLAISDKQQQIENNTLVDHLVGHCTSNELYKYVLDDSAKGVFAGKMLIRKDAQQTVSHQTNRNLCLTKSAHIYTQPQLEIYADDVKCSHGSTVGQLDENALFYMQQRGIPKEEARHLLMFAFAGEVIDAIKIDALRERLHILVEKRFRGELNRCKGCSLCK
ncbi:MAG: Fe-S cluster assembly protein SufD [Bacteroidales bacterium]|nr:Fe-S cluster assembly protein SufD [Bacteroidales bacterium]